MYRLVSRPEFEVIKASIGSDISGTFRRMKNGDYLDPVSYDALVEVTRDKRMKWWDSARFGIFVHYGIFSARGMGEWELAWDGIEPHVYEASANDLCYKKGAAEEWVKLAKDAGAKYMVLTARHHDGFSLWDSETNAYNSVNMGPKTDIVREYTEACRKHGMKIGLYFSVMDWHNCDCAKGVMDQTARKRFCDYLLDMAAELLTNYGKIDIWWYDMPYPYEDALALNMYVINQRIRALQPDIIINNRCGIDEDFSTPEENFKQSGRYWESCLTFNKCSWGYVDGSQDINYSYRPQEIVRDLALCARNRGNYLLNIAPKADGSVSQHNADTLLKVGKWLEKNGESIYGERRPAYGISGGTAYAVYGGNQTAFTTAADDIIYIFEPIWPDSGEIHIAGYDRAPMRIYNLADNTDFRFRFCNNRITVYDLPKKTPDKILGITVLAMQFDSSPHYRFCGAYAHVNNGNRAYI